MAKQQQNTSDQWELPSKLEPIKNIVLVGRIGNGKSATANSIIGGKRFKSEYQAVGVTTKCQAFRVVTPQGSIINVIDTPGGLFDLGVSTEYISKEAVRCLLLAEGEIHAVVLVLSLSGRISQEEENTLSTLQLHFGSNILDSLIVLFTCGDILEAQEMTIEKYLAKGCPEFLKAALILCEGRWVVFDNRTTDKEKKANQLQELLAYVEVIEKKTHGNPYPDRMHRRIQASDPTASQEEAERVRKDEKETEEKNIVEAEKAELKRQLEMSHGQNMNLMAQMMERMLRESAAANERQKSDEETKTRLRAQEYKQFDPRTPEYKPECNIM